MFFQAFVEQMIAVFSECHVEHLNSFCWQSAELLRVKSGDARHSALEDSSLSRNVAERTRTCLMKVL
jgi:hypothetical protein